MAVLEAEQPPPVTRLEHANYLGAWQGWAQARCFFCVYVCVLSFGGRESGVGDWALFRGSLHTAAGGTVAGAVLPTLALALAAPRALPPGPPTNAPPHSLAQSFPGSATRVFPGSVHSVVPFAGPRVQGASSSGPRWP